MVGCTEAGFGGETVVVVVVVVVSFLFESLSSVSGCGLPFSCVPIEGALGCCCDCCKFEGSELSAEDIFDLDDSLSIDTVGKACCCCCCDPREGRVLWCWEGWLSLTFGSWLLAEID